MNTNNQNEAKPKAELFFKMKPAELPLSIACLAGISLKIFKLPGGSMLLLLSLSMLSILYLFTAMSPVGDEKNSPRDKMIFKLNGFGSSVAVIAILFLLQHWPGSKIMILMSSIMLLGTLFYMINAKSKNPELQLFNSRIIFRTISIASLEILLYLVS